MQHFLLLCVLLLGYMNVIACNICGCSISNTSPGIMPQFNNHFVGLRHQFKSYESRHPGSIINPIETKGLDAYQFTEVWGRWYPSKQLQVFASLPYVQLHRFENNENFHTSGIGDASFLLNYILYKTKDSSSNFSRHLLSFGSGMKFKTGHFDSKLGPYFQVGSGTTDYRLYLSYLYKYKTYGLLNELSWAHQGINPMQYQAGQKSMISSQIFKVITAGKQQIMPHLGWQLENSKKDLSNGIIQTQTGGYSHLLNIGLDVYKNNFSIGLTCVQPIIQHLNDGLTTENRRIQLQFIYNIKKNTSCSTTN